MRVVVVSGIWPPDVGGPATHATELCAFLAGRGHGVEAVVTADGPPPGASHPVRWVSRRLPAPARHAAAALEIARRARAADVVYTTGMFARSAAGAAAARRPYAVKLTGDPAFERARWRGLVDGDVEGFQRGGGGVQAAVLRLVRAATLRPAAHVFCPSAYLAGLAVGWGVAPERVSILPNPGPARRPAAGREELRARLGLNGPTLAFAGRLTAQKSLDVALEALARTPGVALVVAGDGGERPALERRAADLGLAGRVRFVGPLPREQVLELLAAADAALLTSSWENFPHGLVEALGVGTPVVATDVGGVTEVVRDGENGLLVAPRDPAALAAALERFFADPALRERLRAGTLPSAAPYAPGVLFARVEQVLLGLARRR
ncbi:MAG TPA: glycosyltransferase family 4 protein [Gaiellaceae bacterium]|nr:glycosyltransferase family 4 protein [Gaiellaceae bacterium]